MAFDALDASRYWQKLDSASLTFGHVLSALPFGLVSHLISSNLISSLFTFSFLQGHSLPLIKQEVEKKQKKNERAPIPLLLPYPLLPFPHVLAAVPPFLVKPDLQADRA